MKTGWKTSEFWVAMGSQVITLCVLLGLVPAMDAGSLTGAVERIAASVAVILANGAVLVNYIKSRTNVKEKNTLAEEGWQLVKPGKNGNVLPAILLAVLFCSGAQVQAEPILPWRAQVEQRLQRLERTPAPPQPLGQDPVIAEALRRLAANQEKMLELMSKPLQQIPLGGLPRQEIPLGGPPRQEIPLGGPPRQEVPLGTPPKQEVPIGGPPRQDIPILPGQLKPPPVQSMPLAASKSPIRSISLYSPQTSTRNRPIYTGGPVPVSEPWRSAALKPAPALTR